MITYSQFVTWGSLRILADSDSLSIVAYFLELALLRDEHRWQMLLLFSEDLKE